MRAFLLRLADEAFDARLALARDHGAHLHAVRQPVAHLAFSRGFHHTLRQFGTSVANGDRHRRRQAALSGAAERGVGQNPRGHFHVGVRHHDYGILGAALALRAFAVGRCPAIDVARGGRRSHEADGANPGMVEDGVHRLAPAVHQLDDACGKAAASTR